MSMKYFKKLRRLLDIFLMLDVDNLAYDITIKGETKQLIIDLNTKDQLYEGINADGEDLESIGGQYSNLTIEIKKREGLPTDRITLFQTGDFYDTFEIEPFKGGFEIFADTDKESGDLQIRWGTELLGLTEENKKTLINHYKNEILKAIRKKLSSI